MNAIRPPLRLTMQISISTNNTPKKYECCIGLCVFNSSMGLPCVIENIRKIAYQSECFHTVHVIFFYDTSIDDTLEKIEAFYIETNDDPGSIITVDIIQNGNSKSILRTENIAHARNGIMEKIRESYHTCEFFMMMDANDYACVGEINLPVLREVFTPNNIKKWDAVSFDREAGYYDTWALSFGDFVYSFFHFYDWKYVVEIMRNEFNKLLEEYKEKCEFMPVYSAFNGFAVYKTSKFIDCFYSHVINTDLFPPGSVEKQIELVGRELKDMHFNDVEHRHFHLQSIRRHDSKICIFPKHLFLKVSNPNPLSRGPS